MTLTLLLPFACSSAPVQPEAGPVLKLTLAGSSTVQPVAEIAAEAYSLAHPGAQIDVQGGGSSVGISSVRSGLADIGMVSRALRPDEADLTATTIGYDGIAMVVHTQNPKSDLTHQQVVDLYSGATTTWAALGGEDHPITLVNKEEGRSTRELFEHHFDLKGKFAQNAVIIGPNGQAITTVAGNPWAIAYVSIGSASVAATEGVSVKTVALDGVLASVAAVESGAYPLTRPLNFVTRGAPTGDVAAFLSYALSAAGQAIVAKNDFVPVNRAPPPP